MAYSIKPTFVLATIFIMFQCKLWFGKDNIFELKAINRKIEVQKVKNDALSARNQKLAREIELIKVNDNQLAQPVLLEDYARWKVGMIKPGEVFYYW